MAQYISKGQKITAEWLNGLVDRANGAQIPYSEGVIQTASGPLMRNWTPDVAYENDLYQLHQVRMGPAQTKFGNYEQSKTLEEIGQHMWLFLGRSFGAWCDSFNVAPYYVDRGLILKQSEHSQDDLVMQVLDQNWFTTNDAPTNAKECETEGQMLSCELSSSGTTNQYSGWVETPFGYNTHWMLDPPAGDYEALYCHLIDFGIPAQESCDSMFLAAVYTTLDQRTMQLVCDQQGSALAQILGVRPRSVVHSTKICERGLQLKIPGTDDQAIPRLNQLMTGPISMAKPAHAELAPEFSLRTVEIDGGVYYAVDVQMPATTPMVESFQKDGNTQLYVSVNEATCGGLPVYVKVHEIDFVERPSGQTHVYQVADLPSEFQPYVKYEDRWYSSTYSGLISIKNAAIFGVSGRLVQEGSRLPSQEYSYVAACWAKPSWSKDINKWTIEIDTEVSLDQPAVPSPSATDEGPFAKAWCLGWAGINPFKLGKTGPANVAGDKHGTAVMTPVDSQFKRRESSTYSSLDDGSDTYSSLGYEATQLTETQNATHNLASQSTAYDYRPLELYRFNSSSYAEQTALSSALNDQTKKISFVCRVENDGDGTQGKDVKLEYFQASALSGGGGSGSCLSAQGNVQGNLPVYCQDKLLQFASALSSNVEIDIAETVPGTVDVKIGVFYV